ncbi:MAG: EscU/YscU/HrcU family type III secretion system export apparatus switch protein [Treponema sp.]|nr:EscU/YscU/HrcU family type III secretion system export apparatus switch protein [Treponema sp.]
MSQIDLQWFSAEDEGKTEEPSEYKLRKARNEEGRVPKSQELNSTLIYLFQIMLLILLSSWMLRSFKDCMRFFFTNIFNIELTNYEAAYAFARYFIKMVIPFGILGLTIGVVSNLVQNKGFLYAPKLIMPKFDKLIPHFGQYLKRTMFSLEGGFNIVKSLLKVVVITFAGFLIIRGDILRLLSMTQTGSLELAMGHVARMAAKMLIISAVFLLAIGIVDYLVQKRQFMENMKMTKQEVKEEFKEQEGDPEVKSRLENAQKELLARNMPKAVREADVLVTNPTHFAVALEWKRNEDDAPKVTAKGSDLTALNMKRIAKEADVPIVENKPLARGLYTETEIGDIIPEAYIKAIATIYAQIGYMSKKK